MSQRTAYGGQAVIEGVMIRGKERVATAVRLKDGSITIRHDNAEMIVQRHRWLGLAFLRGTPALIDSMRLGYRTLMWSADQAMEGEQQQKPSPWQYALSIAIALIIGIGFFGMFPAYLAKYLGMQHATNNNPIWYLQLVPSREAILPNIIEGLIRVVLLVGYIGLIGIGKEIKRVFAYHGAEHKVVNAWEQGVTDLTVESTRKYSRIHPRCGTSFIFLVFVVGIMVHALIGFAENDVVRMLSRIVLLPIVAGIAYELIRLAGRFRNSFMLYLLVWPGLLLQRMTTAEPTDDQVEVAIAAMRSVLEEEGVIEPAPQAEPVVAEAILSPANS